MAASSSTSLPSAHQDHHRTGDEIVHRRDAKHRRHHIDHLRVQVPAVVPNTTSSCFIGCFRPSSSSSSSPAAQHVNAHGHGHGHADRPASPSLIRSPTAWIRSFGSGKHTRRRSLDFQYDATSYARNFDEGGTDGEGEEDAGNAASDSFKYRLFTSRLPTSPPAALSPSSLGPGGAGNNGKGTEPARAPNGT